jgi:hypothetical protein
VSVAALVSERYLADADGAGLLHQVHGHRYVAGFQDEPMLNERQFLVEYCDEALLADRDWLAGLADHARALEPEVAAVIVRAPATVRIGEPWHRSISYVSHPGGTAQAAPADPSQGVTVAPAEAGDEADIAGWLVRAMVTGSTDRGRTADPATAELLVQEWLKAPGRFAYVARLDGRAVGHATLLCDAEDEVTGRRVVELVDTLVDLTDPPVRRAALAALTSAAIAHAERLGLPLMGHVVHPAPDVAAGHGDRIVASLLSRGWQLDHVFWRRPVTPPEGA